MRPTPRISNEGNTFLLTARFYWLLGAGPALLEVYLMKASGIEYY